MNTQYRKNLKAVLEASKSYCDESIANLEWQIGTYNYDVATDSNVARLKTLPSDTYKSQIDYIGGKTVKYNQLFNLNGVSNETINGITFTKDTTNNKITINGTSTGAIYKQTYLENFVSGHKYMFVLSGFTNSNCYLSDQSSASVFGENTRLYETNINTAVASGGSLRITIPNNKTFTNNDLRIETIDLTDIFGAGNEPSTVETAIPLLKANGYKLDGTDEYSVSKWKHAIVSGVKYEGNLYYDNASDYTKPVDYYIYPITLEQGTYTLSALLKGTAMTGVAVGITPYGDRYNQFNLISCIRTTGATNTETFTVDSSWTSPKLCIYASNTAQIEQIFSNYGIMLVKGSTAPSTYIPYVAPITKAIPSEVLALELYKSAGSVYDVIDFNSKVGTRKVETHTFTANETIRDFVSADGNCRFRIEGINGKGSSGANVKPNAISATLDTITPANWYNRNATGITFGIAGYGVVNSLEISIIGIDTQENALTFLNGKTIQYELVDYVTYDLAQYFDTNWNKVDLDNQYATCEMVCDEPIDMPNSITNLIKEVKA